MTTDYHESAQRLRNAVEPVAAGVYFAPEAHAAYGRLGSEPSPKAAQQDGIARPEMTSSLTSRGAATRHVPGEVVDAAFGCFNPEAVVPGVAAGWQITDGETTLRAREQGATAMLKRVLGEEPEGRGRVTELLERAAAAAPWSGHAISSGLRSLGFPDPRWVTCGTQRTWGAGTGKTATSSPGQPRYTPSRGWSDADIDAGSDLHRIAGVYNVGVGPHVGSGLIIATAGELFGMKG